MTLTENIALLEKYGLKTDTKSIKERVEKDTYISVLMNWIYIPSDELLCDVGWEKLNEARTECRTADLAILCYRAEMGERDARWERIVKQHRIKLEPHRHVSVCAPFALNELDEIIAEAEGEPK